MKLIMLAIILVFPAIASAEIQPDVAEKVETYLNHLTTMGANFTQVDANGNIAGGKFLLKRPGKFLWEYDERQPLEIVSDGQQLVYYDKKLKEVTYTGLQDSLAGFLARKNISFSGDVKLLSADDKNGLMQIKLTQTDKPEQGKLTMFFDDKEMKITQLEIEDQNGGATKIVFTDQQFGQNISDKSFAFIDPKFGRNVWERD